MGGLETEVRLGGRKWKGRMGGGKIEGDAHIVEPGQPLRLARAVAGFREDSRRVDGDRGNADPPRSQLVHGDVRDECSHADESKEGKRRRKTHSWTIWSQIESCTRRATCNPLS